jgi:hypothetical protein
MRPQSAPVETALHRHARTRKKHLSFLTCFAKVAGSPVLPLNTSIGPGSHCRRREADCRDMLDALSRLVDKSLMTVDGGDYSSAPARSPFSY